MLSTARTRISAAFLLGVAALLVLALVGPAYAAKPASTPGNGPQARAAKASSAQWTEDNDTNDGNTPNNVVDDGDNAHPSGKDRSVEHGRSGNQGKAKADPDDTSGPKRSNGGVDQPNKPGGADKADQDGNNGCGNDDDFEDDNNGWCGGKAKPSKPSKPGKPTPNTPTNPGNPTNPGKPSQVGVCHRTGSMTNPYVYIEISEKGLAGHGRHADDVINVSGPDSCPKATTSTPPGGNKPGKPGDDADGDVVIRRPDSKRPAEEPIVIVNTTRRTPTPTPGRTVDRADNSERVLAATGGRVPALLGLAGLSLLMGAGLLGSRRFVWKQ